MARLIESDKVVNPAVSSAATLANNRLNTCLADCQAIEQRLEALKLNAADEELAAAAYVV